MKKNIYFLIGGLALLLAFQAKVVVPIVYDIAASDFFLEDSGDEANRTSSTTLMTDNAFTQCNSYIANELLSDDSISFAEKPLNAFGLGNFRYVINSDIEIQPNDSAAYTKRYVCRIQYTEGDDTSGLSEPDNWSIDGLSGLEDSNVL